ncbi:hypothetical protein [Streptomyces sp. NBC_00687]|uniref:hypothetical protein n=1 Tax=Streptomyces sp. NBC_00687 TaxID=2975807 RepID=UPI00224D3232|nr:hypothetical protein [Streptomyces sp. NBC_00687]MCX4912810.1 hypothetical protein [Streptomyces sp. NBC_00687]
MSVATAATLLSGADGDSVSGQTVYVTNAGANPIFLGGSGVSTATGYPLAAGVSLPWPVVLGVGEALYGIVAAATESAKVLRTGV